MRGRTILMLLAILVVLAGIGALFETSRNRATHVSQTTVFQGLKTDLVDGIRVKWRGKETSLEKKNGTWLVATEGDHPAERKYVADILSRLPKYYSDEVVSTNPANQSLFEVDSSGVEVWVKQSGKEIGHFFVGKPGPDFLSTYVRPAGTNKVILVPDYLPSLFQRQDTWREKTIFGFAQDSISMYEYQSPGRGHVLLKRQPSGVWRMEMPDSGGVNATTLGMPLKAICGLRASGFADTVSAATTGIAADTSHVTATLLDGRTYTLHIGLPTGANKNFAKRDGSDQVFTIPRGAVNTMMPPAPMLRASAAPEIQEPGEASSPR
jgi:hypothetical protein